MKDIIKISKTLKLLYVEDDEESRIPTLEMLRNFFIDISVAEDGQEALKLYNKNKFDLIISDINMPKLSGVEMLKEIRKTDSEIPVLIFSAHNEVKYFIETIKLGVDGYILKPLEFSQFILVIKKVLDKIKLKNEAQIQHKNLENEIQARTKKLQTKLHYDSLTGLLSRYSFFNDIKEIEAPVVFIIDIDKFNIINEIYSTSVGSLVLKKFAHLLLDFTKNTTYKVYRLASDEFLILDNAKVANLKKYKKDIEDIFKKLESFKVELIDDTIFIDITIGCSILQNDALTSARIALDFAKNNHKPYAIYAKTMDTRKEEENALRWKIIIKSAIEKDSVVPIYQTIVNKSKKIVKYKIDIYIENFSDELTLPSCFLDYIAKTKYYDELSSRVILKAFEIFRLSDKVFNFNFRCSDIKNKKLLNKIESYFKKNNSLGNRTVFEITENNSTDTYGELEKFINHFRKYGVKMAINNFGSIFSNFKFILSTQPDYLIVDGPLIKNIQIDEKSYNLLKAIVKFSHELGIKIITRDVDSKKNFEMLKSIDIDEFQGSYFSKPLVSI